MWHEAVAGASFACLPVGLRLALPPVLWNYLQMGLIAPRIVHDGSIRRFWIAVGIERQRVLSQTPGAALIEAPEGDTIDRVLLFLEDREVTLENWMASAPAGALF